MQTLRDFESASRLVSFSAAEREFNIPQGCVSRQIRYLEQRLGVRLSPASTTACVQPPPAGRFADALRDALTTLTQATGELVGDSPGATITVGATSAVASLWLMPRLTGIRQRQPPLT